MNNLKSRNKVVSILFAEDNEDDAIIVREILKDHKIVNVVDTVEDGEEALAYLRKEGEYANKEKPGLVLLDINMPKKNGFEVLEAMKDDPQLKEIPVVMLTTSNNPDDVKKAYAKGACTYMLKASGLDFSKVLEHFSFYWALVAEIP